MIQKPPIIVTEDLTPKDLPPVSSDWATISKFALTFDPHENEQLDSVFPKRTARIRSLRMNLYIEQRRWNHYNQLPDKKAMEEINNIVQKIRDLLL